MSNGHLCSKCSMLMQTLAQLTQFVHESELVEASSWKWFWKSALSLQNRPNNEFATIAIKMVYNPPQKNNSNGPIFMYDLLKSCLTLHSMFDVGSKSNGHKFELLPHENGFPIPP
jgi:hypothetical protein